MKFTYRAKSATGIILTGELDAASIALAAGTLIQGGMIPLDIQEKKETPPENIIFGRPSLQDLMLLSRQMSALTRAGVPVMRAIRVVGESSKNKRLSQALKEVISSIESGQSLAMSLRKHSSIFPTLMISLVNIGESSGSLDEVFRRLALHFDRESEMRKQIKAATRYPMIVMGVISAAIIIVNLVVIPAFASFFKQFNAQLPVPTKILIKISDFMVAEWYMLLAAILLCVFLIHLFLKTTSGRLSWDRWKLRIPLLGSIIERSLLARFSRAFSVCLRTGVPLLESIVLIAHATDNAYIGSRILEMRHYIERGESLSNAAIKTGIFTPLILQMLIIGEETGEIDTLLDEVADFFEQEVDYDAKRLGDAIEPLLIIIIGGIVLVLALGIFLPMWDLSNVALRH
jgi:MSHA biogenesis protein MshG